jgi:hypothetical protein
MRQLIAKSRVLPFAAVLWSLAACTSTEVMIAHSVDLVPAQQAIAEEHLLDVGVTLFDPGVPEGEIDKDVLEELLRDGTFVQIRRAESLYMAVQLQKTLQQSGHWGTIWVTPEPTNAADLNVSGEILHSDGDIVRVHVTAVDAAGRVWIDDRYELETAAGSYNRQRYPDLDPYQDLFNSIANDLAAAQARLSVEEAERIRTVAALRYAEELSPEAFSGYVEPGRNGVYALNRLPAVEDPMFDRTQRVRQRERLFVETLNEHYARFSREAAPSYDGWREYAREEAISIRELTKSARWRTGLGIATIVASVVYGSNSNNSFSDRVVRDALMYMGMDVLRTGAVRRQEKRLHTSTLEELSESFSDEVQPLVVEIQGTQHRLTGTAQVQYQEWRDLLQRMFIDETGFVPEEMSIYVEPEPELVPGIELAPLPTFEAPALGAESEATALGTESEAGAAQEGQEPSAADDSDEEADRVVSDAGGGEGNGA